MKRKFLLILFSMLMVMTLSIGLVACSIDPPNHTHTYAKNWSYDDEYHWHAATCEHSQEINDRSVHVFENDECTVCGYKRQGQNPDKEYYTVKFDLNGGQGKLEDMQFARGELMAQLPSPTRDGYKFICWVDKFTDKEYTASSVMPNENLHLKAKWAKVLAGYTDEYVAFRPATEGVKDPAIKTLYQDEVDRFVYVEITSDDLGGVNKVGQANNFNLKTMDGMEYSVNSGYTWMWYQGNFETPNGAQRFSLNYGTNIQFVTVSDNAGVVQQTYLVDIYVKHDYYISLYKNIYETTPYERIRVIENERFSEGTDIYESKVFEFDSRVYYNSDTGYYEKFVYSTAITKDWDLYQTYKDITIPADTDGGILNGELTITPYTPYFTLPFAQKEGYDFLGWKYNNDSYLTNIQGYSGEKYISEENVPNRLKAVYTLKKYYYTFDGTTFEAVPTIPIVTYTDKSMSEILEIIYSPIDKDCSLPVLTPDVTDLIFMGWEYYGQNPEGVFYKFTSDYKFGDAITSPLALIPETEKTNNKSLPLNRQVQFNDQTTFRAYLPVAETYQLKVTTTGNISFTINAYGTETAKTYTAKSGSPVSVSLNYYVYNLGSKVRAPGYVTITVNSCSGNARAILSGATCATTGDPVVTNTDNLLEDGDKLTLAPVKDGYTFTGFYCGEELLSSTPTFTFSPEKSKVDAKWISCPVSVVSNNSLAGTVSNIPSTTFLGEEITVTATTNKGYTFVGWFKGDVLVSKELQYKFELTSATEIYTAKWIKIDIQSSNTKAGTVTSLNGTYMAGDEVTVTATTKSGYTFVGWFNGETKLTDELSYTFNMPEESATYLAKWIKVSIVVGEVKGGSVSSLSGQYKVGQEVTVTATTWQGYTFVGWFNGETKLTDELSYTFKMPDTDTTYTAVWTSYSVTVKTIGNGGFISSDPSSLNRVTAGNSVKLWATTNNGYTFLGWYSEQDECLSNENIYSFEMPEKNIVICARWDKFTITTAVNDEDAGTITEFDKKAVRAGEDVSLTATTNKGYTFLGWYDEDELLSEDEVYEFKMPQKNIVYTAKWTYYTVTYNGTDGGQIIGGTITFDLNGATGEIAPQVVDADTFVVYPKIPQRKNHVFRGWYLDKECTTLYDFASPVSEDITLYAGWRDVSIYTNIKSVEIIDITSQYNTADKPLALRTYQTNYRSVRYAYFTALTDGYYYFYYKNSGADSLISLQNLTQNASILASQSVSNTAYTQVSFKAQAGDVIQLRCYNKVSQSSSGTLSFYVSGGKLPSANGSALTQDVKVTVGGSYTVSAKTMDGYTFLGWFDGDVCVSTELNYTFTMEAKNVNYTAKWMPCTVTISVNDENAGSVSSLPPSTAVGQAVTVTATTNPGYTFAGWFKDGELVESSLTFTFTMPSEDTVYTAKWIKVTLESSDNERGTIPSLTDAYISGQEVTVEAATNSGYTFAGWFKNGELVESGLTLTFAMPSEDTVYTAKWVKVTLESSKENAGKITSLDGTYLTGDSLAIMAETNPGYTWVGWYVGDQLLTSEFEYVLTMPAEDVIYTAKWIKVVIEKSITDAGNVTSLDEKYVTGDSSTITAETNPGYTWIGWYVDDQLLTSNLEYTFTMPSEDITYTAFWIRLTVNKNISKAGDVTTLDGTYLPGDSITVTASTNLGYTWLGWYDGNSLLTEDLEYQLSMPAKNLTLTAKWALNKDMAGLIFTSTNTTCIITGVEDENIAEITIPEYITEIQNDVFKNCYQLVVVYNLSQLNIAEGETSNGYVGYYAKKILTDISGDKWIDEINDFVFFVDGNDVYLLTYKGNTDSLVLPENYNGKSYKVNMHAFRETSFISVTVSNGVAELGNYAFYSCPALQTITILSDNVIVGTSAFGNCKIETANIPTSVITKIPQKNLVTVVINGGNGIPDYAFKNCTTLESVTIPTSVTSIGNSAFYGCTKLTGIQIPNSIKKIGDIAFAHSGITSITIPNSVTSLGGGMFWASNLTSATINANVTELPSYKDGGSIYTIRGFFYGCPITSVKLPNTLTKISESMFFQCTWLKTIVIPDSVTTISTRAFSGCSQLKSITIGRGVTQIIGGAFYKCYNLTSAKFLNTTGWKKKDKYGKFTDLTEDEVKGFESNPYLLYQSSWNLLTRG